uniref:Uncharacterized protein n=1 Tax=viral metagenome TaxID=1070528 RepID=A0A2V0RK96_9ZZZZ
MSNNFLSTVGNLLESGDANSFDTRLPEFESWALNRVATGVNPTFDDCVKWWSDKGIQLSPLQQSFLATTSAEGYTSSNYSWDEPTRYGIIYTTWQGFAKKEHLRSFVSEEAFMKGRDGMPALTLLEAWLFFKSLSSQALPVSDPIALRNAMDAAWAGAKMVYRLKDQFKDAGVTTVDLKNKTSFAPGELDQLVTLEPHAQRAVVLAARLSTYITKGKDYGPLVAKGSLSDNEYLGILHRLIDKRWLGDDFSFLKFPELARRLKALNLTGDGLVFNSQTSWKQKFQAKGWSGPNGILARLTKQQRDEIINTPFDV